MKSFSERNPLLVGAVGVGLTVAAVFIGLDRNDLPFIHPRKQYSAYFDDAGGPMSGAAVQVSGYQVGSVSGIALDGGRALVTFKVDDGVRLGDLTEAAIKTKSLLGAKVLNLVPRGTGVLAGPIPVERTRSPYQLPDALGDLATTIDKLDTPQLSQSLDTLAAAFAGTTADLQVAVQGLGRFSESLNSRDAKLRSLLANANKVTKVLADRSDQWCG